MSATGRPSTGDYREHGAYYTRREVAAAIVNRLPLKDGDVILEPSSGKGGFLEALIARREREGLKLELLAMDIDPKALTMTVRNPKFRRSVQSFLTEPVDFTHKSGSVHRVQTADPYPPSWPRPNWVIGNPPYGVKLPDEIRKPAVPVAEPHCWRALELTLQHVVFVLRGGFMASAGRNRKGGLLDVHPERGTSRLSPRPGFGGGTDMATYVAAWWDSQWSSAGGDPFFPSGCGTLLWKP